MKHTALVLIDLQNDYFSSGKFPLWNVEQTLESCLSAIEKANNNAMPIILVKHVVHSDSGGAPFFNEGTEGVNIPPDILSHAPDALVVVKEFADSFEQTNLDTLLQQSDIKTIIIGGMMTQNCVTHTAISKTAEKYNVKLLTDCCTTVDEMIHNLALRALSTRIDLIQVDSAWV
ncbi:cysteine hydrolase family protein [Teredinibacter sp. KSP-S5-2]|uniref:cysteine hydrolase family protein n=1 Tax=Teredinibacter sp. KSP-S5-2 TaxID=3034506 RepID=UPI0029346C9F|nr:cysteine hydrolase family protein [Teredinibacter sp. KSP-S5-2]WNO09943.1 cysteine hydrolase family protein [Teredinibacter sp. KSP-S5-2]